LHSGHSNSLSAISSPEIWHAHPVWFLDGNPIVGYSKLKDSVRLLFWRGQSFAEEGLNDEGSFKAAEARYTSVKEINKAEPQAMDRKRAKDPMGLQEYYKKKRRAGAAEMRRAN
jgi:hypothetical protein